MVYGTVSSTSLPDASDKVKNERYLEILGCYRRELVLSIRDVTKARDFV